MQEAEIRRNTVPGQLEKKFVRLHLNRKKAGHGGMCLSSQLHEAQKKNCSPGCTRQKLKALPEK
jgi:hypothetical protein